MDKIVNANNMRIDREFKVPLHSYVTQKIFFCIEEEATRKKWTKTNVVQDIFEKYFYSDKNSQSVNE